MEHIIWNNCYCLVTKLCLTLFETPWTTAHQAPLFMGFPKQEYWNGLPFPFPGALPDPGIESESPTLAGRFFTTEPQALESFLKLINLFILAMMCGMQDLSSPISNGSCAPCSGSTAS